ncbi:coiled-coil domain-containing protein 180-like isoform X2 [Babylonia areolata]|uniref:coiled-coil domain-containing protein 180-like isoform X2 n=1 Tax=Babylonia areolata TaxID=304850 RepID=UPI003FCF66E2
MSDTKAMRVVPSGKVYRQMFDAQLQLSRSLSKVTRKEKTLPALVKVGQVPASSLPSLPVSAPVVHLAREDTKHGLLTSRQQTWVDAFPNDPYVENPVLYKQYQEFVEKQKVKVEGSEASKEVRGLPDVVEPARTGSDIIDRITASRKERHEAAVEDMHQELGVISVDMEPKIAKASQEVLEKLGEGDVQIAHLLSRIEKDEDLLSYSLEDLVCLWEEVQQFSPQRQEWIAQLDAKLKGLEDERMQRIRNVFQEYAKTLEKISYLMAPDLQRFMDKESQALNQTCLSNRRAYADLYVRLMSADIEREKTQHTQWRRRVEDWKNLKTNLAVEKFREFMHSEEILKPAGVVQVQEFMVTELEILNSQRLDLIESLSELKPPSTTKSAVYKWRQQMNKITQEIDAVSQMHMSKLHEEMEKVCQFCLEKIESIRRSLMEAGVVTESRAKQVIEEQMLPLVGEQQRIFENNLETMEKAQEEHSKRMEQEMHSLFKFAQGAAHTWDLHEIGLARQERALQEKLEDCRHDHDYLNQEREANLDIVMDRMRQDATEDALRDSLGKALEMLTKISESYIEFHKDQSDIVHTYPSMVDSELENYDNSVCTFFSVDRMHPEEKARLEAEAAAAAEAEAAAAAAAAAAEQESLSRSPSGMLSSRGSARDVRKSPKKSSRQEEDGEAPKPIQMVVADILKTEKGTTFYVLTRAEDDRIAEGAEGEEGEKEGEGDNKDKGDEPSPPGGAFVTELPSAEEEEKAAEEEEQEAKPEYIRCVDLPPSVILAVKKKMRMNFLNHLESWSIQAKERSASVVVAKCEELNSELDLRLHLHQPRSRRAELDVHNVRAAELVMHGERVTRHCKGIGQSLSELRSRFAAMSSQHNSLAKKFRQDIEALEVIFINATKSSRLVALQNQLGVELEKFMSVIRTSLRHFRQHLDETLQMLRESNARFIKSFKLFSDGGNFCPEEIEEYRKRLEKMSNKIDTAEGSIMSELEGMESKRLDVATKVANEFEDRFKSHMFDLLFMEKVARWLTNTQVKIKAEVAASNSQAQNLATHLQDLERRIDACERPNLDKEQISPGQLNEFLKVVMEAFHRRSEYLNCLKTGANRPPSNIPTGQMSASKVGFTGEGVTPVSKPGKQPSEDPSVNVIKSILKTQKAKFRFGVDADMEGDHGSTGVGTAATPASVVPGGMDGVREKTKSALSQASTRVNGSEKNLGSRRPTLPSIPASDTGSLRRVPSGQSQRRNAKLSKSDKKFLLFGEKEGEEMTASSTSAEETHFVASIQCTLREALNGLLATADLYYRQKGTRAVTRPQVLQETFEQCQDVVTQKLQSYYQQCDDYHNQCLQEFRQQLNKVEQLASRVPALVIGDLVRGLVERATQAHTDLQLQFHTDLDDIKQKQKDHENSLRPNMGHPHHAPQLEALCQQESQRHDQYMTAVAKQTKILQACAVDHAKTLLDALTRLSEQQLLQFDGLLVVDDVEKGRVEPTRYPTSELIRRKNAGEPLEDDEDKDALPRGKGNWLGIPCNQLVLENRPTKLQLTPTVQTAKTTLGHSATVKARDSAYEDYKVQFEKTLSKIEEERERLARDEQHWTTSWLTSVQRIKDLY